MIKLDATTKAGWCLAQAEAGASSAAVAEWRLLQLDSHVQKEQRRRS